MIELSFITRDLLNPNHPCGNPSQCEGFETTISKKDSHCESFFVFGLTPSHGA